MSNITGGKHRHTNDHSSSDCVSKLDVSRALFFLCPEHSSKSSHNSRNRHKKEGHVAGQKLPSRAKATQQNNFAAAYHTVAGSVLGVVLGGAALEASYPVNAPLSDNKGVNLLVVLPFAAQRVIGCCYLVLVK